LAELDPVEALVTHAATGDVPAGALQSSRGWSDEDWAEGVDRLRSRGLLTGSEELTFSEDGRRVRQQIEDATDELALSAYASLGEVGCARLRQLGRPVSLAVVAGGLVSGVNRYIDPD
jgi:hypothetical protein